MDPSQKNQHDSRIDSILNLILEYTKFNFHSREKISEKGDELDSIIVGLNTLGEELESHGVSRR